jgi:hypothetical protein
MNYFDNVATKLLLAEDAFVNQTLNVGSGGSKSAGISSVGGVRFWAGSQIPTSAPFRVEEDGSIFASKGTFSGNLSAEKVIASIAEFGGLTADHIKTGTITADRLAMPTVRLNIPSVTLDYQQKTNAIINLTDITFVGLPMIGSNMNVPQFPGIGESNAIEVRDSSGENSGRAYIEMFSKNTVVLILKNESAFGSTRSYEYGSAFIELTYMEN